MDEDLLRRLMRSVMESIVHVQGSAVSAAEARAIDRVLAHLWSAHDELELLGGKNALLPAHDVATELPIRSAR